MASAFTHTITIDRIDLYPIAASDGVSPQMAIGSMPVRPALLLRIADRDGCYGWGEVWANFPPRAHRHKANIIEDVIAPVLCAEAYVQPHEIQQQLRDQLAIYFLHVGQQQVFEHILAGIDIALWDLALRKHALSAVEYFAVTDTAVPCYASSVNESDLDTVIAQAVARGQKHYKIKIGFQDDAGCALVQRAATLCPTDGRVMIDSNQSWSVPQATEALQKLQDHNPLFAEEPIAANASLTDWEALARSTRIPLAGGENIYGVERFVEMANAGLAVLQPDVAKWGGLSGALALADKLPHGVQLWPHFMGTAVGQMASLTITAVAGTQGSLCEMDVNKNALRTELCHNADGDDAMHIVNGCVNLHRGPGLVTEPSEFSLQRFAVSVQ